MIEPLWELPSTVLSQPLDPSLVAEIDDASLCEAVAAASLVDRIVIVTELFQRGVYV